MSIATDTKRARVLFDEFGRLMNDARSKVVEEAWFLGLRLNAGVAQLG